MTLFIPEVLESIAIEDQKTKIVTSGINGEEKVWFISIGPLGLRKAKQWLKLLSETVLFKSWLVSPNHIQRSASERVENC